MQNGGQIFIYTNHNKDNKKQNWWGKWGDLSFWGMLVQESNLGIVLRNVLLLVKAGSIALNWSELDSFSEYLWILAKSACQATVYKRKCVVYKVCVSGSHDKKLWKQISCFKMHWTHKTKLKLHVWICKQYLSIIALKGIKTIRHKDFRKYMCTTRHSRYVVFNSLVIQQLMQWCFVN